MTSRFRPFAWQVSLYTFQELAHRRPKKGLLKQVLQQLPLLGVPVLRPLHGNEDSQSYAKRASREVGHIRAKIGLVEEMDGTGGPACDEGWVRVGREAAAAIRTRLYTRTQAGTHLGRRVVINAARADWERCGGSIDGSGGGGLTGT